MTRNRSPLLAIVLVLATGCQANDGRFLAATPARPVVSAHSVVVERRVGGMPAENLTPPQREVQRRDASEVVPGERSDNTSMQEPAGVDPAEEARSAKHVLRPGDRLELLYTESWAVEGNYRLLPGDKIKVEYLHLMGLEDNVDARVVVKPSGLDRVLTLAPDGKVSLPYLGGVESAGLSVAELTDRLNARYQEYFVEPFMLVTLVETGSRLRDLRDAIRTGGSRLVTIAPDGTINLPHVGVVRAADLNLGELQAELSERYRRSASGLSVTVRLARRSENSQIRSAARSAASSTAPLRQISRATFAGPEGGLLQ